MQIKDCVGNDAVIIVPQALDPAVGSPGLHALVMNEDKDAHGVP